jgi:hypothetical protein
MEIPEEYTVTHRDESFLPYNSGIDSPAKILIFSTEINLRALTTTGHWFVDDTFKTAPELFYQIYTIHALLTTSCHVSMHFYQARQSKPTRCSSS